MFFSEWFLEIEINLLWKFQSQSFQIEIHIDVLVLKMQFRIPI